MMRLEDLKLGEWYVVLTKDSRMCGAPLRVQEISPPFVLALDFMDDMVVIDTRTERLGTVTPQYVRKFRRLWKKQVERKKREDEEERTRSVECDGLDITALMNEDPDEE